jgi:Tol biopolymer transport system component
MAQILNVGSIQQVNIPEKADAVVAAISPQGDYLLITSSSNKGLTKFDLNTQATTLVTDAEGAGFDVMISNDGEDIVYRETTYNARHLRHSALKAHNMRTGENRVLVEATRNLEGADIQGATAIAVNNGRMRAMALGNKAATAQRPVLSIKNRQLMISDAEGTRIFSPNGTDHSYLWAQISPDGTKVVYFIASNGTWVCDIDGQNAHRLGILRAPQWVGNDVIVGMFDEDDGEFIYASKIIASDLNGNQQVLTGDNVVAMFPHADAAGSKIAFSTPDGKAYIININK